MMFWTFLLGAMPLDPVGDPLPLYLDDAGVRRALESIPASLVDCASADDLTIKVQMRLEGTGTITVDAMTGADPETSACIKRSIGALNAPKHHGVDVEVKTSIYRRGGLWMISPSPEVVRRSEVPLLLFVTGDEAAGSEIWTHLMGAEEGER